MSFLKPNITRSKSIKNITDAIDNEKPFLFTRFGDGEVWLLMKRFNQKRINRIKTNWQVTDSNYREIAARVRKELIESFNNSNMAGFMNENPLEYGVSIKYKPDVWSIRKDHAKTIGMHNNNITSHLLTRGNELGDPNNFKKILKGKPIHIISPNADLLAEKKLSNILGCNITYTKVTVNPNSAIYQKEKLKKELDKIEESIVLYGCAASGKWIGNYLKINHGKVCLDFGATLDAWAGIISRSWFKTTQKHLLIKK